LSAHDILHTSSVSPLQLLAHNALLSRKTISLCLSDACLTGRQFADGDRPSRRSGSVRKNDHERITAIAITIKTESKEEKTRAHADTASIGVLLPLALGQQL
jgi:hypothetical protein